MESCCQPEIRSASLGRMVFLGALLALLLALWIAAPVAAQSSCPPQAPACCGGSRGDDGSGSVPGQPPQPLPPGGGSPPSGNPGDGGGPPAPQPQPPVALPPATSPGPGAGDDEPPGDRDEFYMNYSCTSLPFCPELADFTVYCEYASCYVVDFTCLSYEECSWGNSGDTTPGDEWPCEPGYGDGGLYFECDGNGREGWSWGWNIYAWADVPPHRVQIKPFPRWMVGEPGTMCLTRSPNLSVAGGPEGAGLSEGFWSHKVNIPNPLQEEPAPGDIKDYRIGVRWRMLSPGESLFGGPATPQSCWFFNEREWNGVAAGCGECIGHTYETSSFGLPENGPHFFADLEGCDKVPSANGQWTNPAYQVQVPTYWVAEWADEWYAWEVVRWENGGCFYTETPAAGTQSCSEGEHAGEANWYRTQGDPVYDWVQHFVGWYPVDLRRFGAGDWWYINWAVITTGSGPWCAWEYSDPNPGMSVRIPVIEVQSILTDDCRLRGDCGDLNPPDSEGAPEPTVPPVAPLPPTDGDEPPEGCSLCP